MRSHGPANEKIRTGVCLSLIAVIIRRFAPRGSRAIGEWGLAKGDRITRRAPPSSAEEIGAIMVGWVHLAYNLDRHYF